MKRILALLLALVMLLTLSACGKDEESTPTGESTGVTTNTTESTNDPTDGTQDSTQGTTESTTGGNTTETTEPPITTPPTTTPPTTTTPTTTPPTTTPPTTTPPTTTPPTTTPPTTTLPTATPPTTEAPHTHSYSSKVTTAATCGKEGVKTFTCSCGHSYTEKIAATGQHSWKTATCTTQKTCKTCGAKEGDPKGHTIVIDAAVAPTHTTRGKTEGSHCSVCQTVIIEQEDISTIWDGITVKAPSKIVNIDGTNYYEINSAEELAYLSTVDNEWLKYNYVLGSHIILNLNKIEYDSEGNLMSDLSSLNPWTPIGAVDYSGNSFDGLFDGRDYYIYGIFCVNENVCSGLFGTADNVISNLHIANSYIQGGRYTGGICGQLYGSVNNCSFDGIVIGKDIGAVDANAGGICGSAYISSKGISNCVNYGTIIGEVNAGGIASYSYWGFENCINYGTVVSLGASASGIGEINEPGKQIVNCCNYGDVTGIDRVGGISAEIKDGICINSINYGKVSGFYYVGGIVGNISKLWGSGGKVNKCHNLGSVSGTEYVGGIAGSVNEFSLQDCKNQGNVLGERNVGAITGYADILFGNAKITNCFYLKNEKVNTKIIGIGNAEDVPGQTEAKDDSYFKP